MYFRNIGIYAVFIAISCYLSSCKDDEKAASDEPQIDGTVSGADTVQPDASSGTQSPIPTTVAGNAACDTLAHGATSNRTPFNKATVTLGLETCESEVQTLSCANGVTSVTGTYVNEGCETLTAELSAGDILVMRENDGGTSVGAKGKILAFSKTAGYKGFAFDSSNLVPWYAYGLRLSYHYFDDKYFLEVGSSDENLAIKTHSFGQISSYPHTLSGPTATNSVSDAQYFQGAFSEEYNTARHTAVENGRKIDVFSWGVRIDDCQIVLPAGKHARAIYSGTQNNFYSTYVAYTMGTGTGVTGYGVGKLTGSCQSAGGTPRTLTVLFEETLADAKITSVLELRTATAPEAGSWRSDIMVTVGGFLYGQTVAHWHYDTGTTTWSKLANQFQNTAKSVFQDAKDDVYTVEIDGPPSSTAMHIRRYTVEEVLGTHFKETLFTDEDHSYLDDTALGTWMVVLPTID